MCAARAGECHYSIGTKMALSRLRAMPQYKDVADASQLDDVRGVLRDFRNEGGSSDSDC